MSDLLKPTIKFIVVKGVKYLRAEDVASYLQEIAATEESDTRNRLNKAAQELLK